MTNDKMTNDKMTNDRMTNDGMTNGYILTSLHPPAPSSP